MLFYFAVLVCLMSIGLAIDLLIGLSKMKKLESFSPADLPLPSLSIVFAALNEERNIQTAVQSLLSIDYPNLEVIAVNDRSTDNTLTILQSIAEKNPRLKIQTIKELPKGWLGKNHALYQGAKASQSELILFTDADIHFSPSALKRAVSLLNQGWDHVAIMPEMKVPGFLLNLMVGVFGMLFYAYIRPWKAQDPKSKYHLGIGAFNLIKRSVYESIGTHEAIKYRPDDDLKLGKLVKLKGFKQIVVRGAPLLSVEWYASFKEFVKGLEKNMGAGADYRFFFLFLSSVSLTLNFVVPYILVWFATDATFFFLLVTILIQLITYMYVCSVHKSPFLTTFGFPLGVVLYQYVMWNAITKTLVHGGIDWRGTFYSLEELKKNKV